MRASKAVAPESWSFAATSGSIEGLARAVHSSLELEADRKFAEGEAVQRMEAASKALNRLLSTGLWGSGPFTVSLSGNDRSLYLAVTVR